MIPTSLGILKNLHFLDLALNNLSGNLPVSLYNLSSMEGMQIQFNMLTGSIASDIGSRFPGMRYLGLSGNQFTGHIPASLSNLTSLQFLYLSANRLSGYVPRTVGRLHGIQYLYLNHNMLEADEGDGWEFITSLSNCSQLERLLITGNPAFTGHLPSSLVNLSTTLQFLTFDATGISGSLPSAIAHRQSGGSSNTLYWEYFYIRKNSR